jgi:peptide/nickel transport system substrate-binding protein
MKKLRWQLLIIFLAGLVVGILLLGEQPEPVSLLTTPEPVKGGVYTEALVGSVMRMNPLLSQYNPVDRDISRLIYSGILRFDGNGAPQPDLAETWGVSQDGTLYNITLKEKAQWHDGQPVTADDVVFTVDLLREGSDIIPTDLQDFWKDVEVVKLDERVLQFRLPEPFAPFADYLTFSVLPRHLLDGKSLEDMIDLQFNIQPVGSGPFRFDRVSSENGKINEVVLAAAPNYYGNKPYIDQIVFRIFPDAQSALEAYQNGEVQGIGQVTQDILPDALAEPNLAIFTARKPELAMVLFNLKSQDAAFFEDVKVRRALLLGLNRQGMVDRLLQSQAVVADGPILPDTWAYYTGLKRVNFDPDEARKMLKDAGYVLASETEVVRKKNDVALRFTLIYPDDEQHQALAEAIQADWAALGAEVSLEAVAYESLLRDRLEVRDYQAALVDLNLSRSPDPDPYPFWDQAQATGGQNYTQWDNRVASEYLEGARVTVNLAERAKFYRNFQIIFGQELPALPLFYPVYTYAVDRAVQGIRVGPIFDPADRFTNVSDWNLAGQKEPGNAAAPVGKP